MTDGKPSFDSVAGHRVFAAHCFNSAWELIDNTNRTPDDDERLVATVFASIYHWLNRPDVTDQNLSIGYWQASRVFALLKRSDEAHRYANLCLKYSENLSPFYLGYAHEAIARAAAVEGDSRSVEQYLAKAKQLAEQVTEQGERDALLADLQTIAG
jgi:hypothetical protein